jgi:hypothetical protein
VRNVLKPKDMTSCLGTYENPVILSSLVLPPSSFDFCVLCVRTKSIWAFLREYSFPQDPYCSKTNHLSVGSGVVKFPSHHQ